MLKLETALNEYAKYVTELGEVNGVDDLSDGFYFPHHRMFITKTLAGQSFMEDYWRRDNYAIFDYYMNDSSTRPDSGARVFSNVFTVELRMASVRMVIRQIGDYELPSGYTIKQILETLMMMRANARSNNMKAYQMVYKYLIYLSCKYFSGYHPTFENRIKVGYAEMITKIMDALGDQYKFLMYGDGSGTLFVMAPPGQIISTQTSLSLQPKLKDYPFDLSSLGEYLIIKSNKFCRVTEVCGFSTAKYDSKVVDSIHDDFVNKIKEMKELDVEII